MFDYHFMKFVRHDARQHGIRNHQRKSKMWKWPSFGQTLLSADTTTVLRMSLILKP